MEFETLKKRASEHGETNDCAVVCLAALLGGDDIAYDLAHCHLKEWGRVKHQGMYMRDIVKAIEDAGIPLEVYGPHQFKARTPISIERDPFFRKGHFVIEFRAHVAAVIDGKVVDWTEGRRHRIMRVFKVRK